jgi:hypothetical protein
MRSEDPTLGASVRFSRYPGIYARWHLENACEPPRGNNRVIRLRDIPLEGYCADAVAEE